MNLPYAHEKHEPPEWAALYANGDLGPEDKKLFEGHLDSGCEECQTELNALGESMVDFAGVDFAVTAGGGPSASVRERLLNRVAQNEFAKARGREGVLLQRAGLLIKSSTVLPWEEAPIQGISSKALYVDAARKYSTSLVRLAPKSVYPSHRHNDIEEVFLLEGDFFIDGVRMGPGDYCRSEPGSVHGESTTESGALLLVFASQQDEMLA
jgi:anti-sigma factor ChrR (cupin superfamily)